METIERILACSLELNMVLEQSPSSVFVANARGEVTRLNRMFQFATKMERSVFAGLTSYDIEREGIFKPSASYLVLTEKKKIAIIQRIAEDIVTFGNPVYNDDGDIVSIVTNALLMGEVSKLFMLLEDIKSSTPTKVTNKYNLMFDSESMKSIFDLVDAVKNTPATILILGETGVGKGVLAKYIHGTSQRSRAKIIEINCGAIPEQLLESELFGYESGAFTGASKRGKPGLIEISDGGTLVLDEISELPLALQVKLLHFLQDKEISRLGGTKRIPIDVRIIAASNKPLREQVDKGLFRSDLYYRLNVIPITIPPLRERREDIIPLAAFFARKFSERDGRALELDAETLEGLRAGPWPGNIRELENHIERLALMIDAGGPGLLEPPPSPPLEAPREPAPADGRLKEMERSLVVQAYARLKSSYKVAKELGISQSSAYRKIRMYTRDS
jgi:transcriptional regulator with PAS, ATPase and Fis domain